MLQGKWLAPPPFCFLSLKQQWQYNEFVDINPSPKAYNEFNISMKKGLCSLDWWLVSMCVVLWSVYNNTLRGFLFEL